MRFPKPLLPALAAFALLPAHLRGQATDTPTPSTNFTPDCGGTLYTFGRTSGGSWRVLTGTGFSASLFNLSQPATVWSMNLYVYNPPAGTLFQFAVYSGSASQLGTPQAVTGAVTAVAGWNSVPLAPLDLNPGTYFLAYEYQAASAVSIVSNQEAVSINVMANRTNNITFGIFPIAAGGVTYSNFTDNLYASYCAAPGLFPTMTPTDTRTWTPSMTPSGSWTPIDTYTFTDTRTPTVTLTCTDSATPTASATPTVTATVTRTPTPTGTFLTPTYTWTITATLTLTPSPSSTPNPSLTPPCGASMGVLGRSTLGSSGTLSASTAIRLSRYGLAAAGVVDTLSCYAASTGNTQVNLALYRDNTNAVGTLIAETGAQNAVSGWNTLGLSSPTTLAAGYYWLAEMYTTTGLISANYATTPTGTSTLAYLNTGVVFGAFPSSLTGLTYADNWHETIFASYCPIPTATPTDTQTPDPSWSPTPSPTDSGTSTPTFTATSSPTRTSTFTITMTRTPSTTSTATLTRTGTATPTWSNTRTSTGTPTPSRTPSATGTPTASSTSTSTPTITFTRTTTGTSTMTLTRTATGTATATGTGTPSPTLTGTRTATGSPTGTLTSSPSSSPTETPSSTTTASASPTRTATGTFASTSTGTSTFTASATASLSPTPSPSRTATATASPSLTPTVTGTDTATPSATATPTETGTSTATPSGTQSPSSTFTWTTTPTESGTPTATGTPTYSGTATSTPTWTPTPTPTPSATDSATATLTPASTWPTAPSVFTPVCGDYQTFGNASVGTYDATIPYLHLANMASMPGGHVTHLAVYLSQAGPVHLAVYTGPSPLTPNATYSLLADTGVFWGQVGWNYLPITPVDLVPGDYSLAVETRPPWRRSSGRRSSPPARGTRAPGPPSHPARHFRGRASPTITGNPPSSPSIARRPRRPPARRHRRPRLPPGPPWRRPPAPRPA